MSYHLQILSELRDLIVENADDEAKIITDGIAIHDFNTYKEHVGRLFAYRRTIDLMQEAAEKVEKAI